MKAKTTLVIVLSLAVTLVVANVFATTEPPPATRDQVAGSWLGGIDSGVHARVEIDRSGKGFVAVQWEPDGRIAVYKVKASSLRGHLLTLSVTPTPGWKQIDVAGRAYPDMLLLRFHVAGAPTGHNLTLERESEVLGRIKALTQGILSAKHRHER